VAQDGSAITWLTIDDTRTDASDTRLLTLAPVVNDPIGVQTVRLFAKIAGAASYDANDYFEFTVTIAACVPTISTTALTVNPVIYLVGDASQNIAFAPFTFTPACAYTFTYTAFLVADNASESALTGTGIPVTETNLAAATNQLAVFTNDAADIATYAIRIKGTLDDAANSNTQAQINFGVDVQKDCTKDTIALNAAVADATYYFNDGATVYTPTWTYKFDGCPTTCAYTQTSSASGNIVTGIDTATGAVTVNTVAEATFDKVDTTITVTCAMDDNASSTA